MQRARIVSTLLLLAVLAHAAHAQEAPRKWRDRLRVDVDFGPAFRIASSAPTGSLLELAYASRTNWIWSIGASYNLFDRFFAGFGANYIFSESDEKIYDDYFHATNPGFLVMKRQTIPGQIPMLGLTLAYQFPAGPFLFEPGLRIGASGVIPPQATVITKEDGGNIYKSYDERGPNAWAPLIEPNLTLRLISNENNAHKRNEPPPTDSTPGFRFGLALRLAYTGMGHDINRTITETVPPDVPHVVTETIPFSYHFISISLGVSFTYGW